MGPPKTRRALPARLNAPLLLLLGVGLGWMVRSRSCSQSQTLLTAGTIKVAPQATEGVLAKPDGDLQPAGLPTATPEAAAALAALQQEARRAQAEFCANHPVLAAEGEALERVMGHPPPPYDSVAYPMWVHTSADIVSQEIKKKGYWEEEDTLELLMKLETFQQAHGLRREDVVLLDIGANVGWYTVTAAALGYTVVAFEPMAPNLAALRRSLCDSPDLMERVTLVPRGLSNTTQDCVFWVAGQNQGNGYARCGPDARSSGGLPGHVKVGEFSMAPLDSVLGAAAPALAGRCGVMKIDVEGFEAAVYEGGKAVMQALQPQYIFAEINGPALAGATGASPQDMFDLYDRLGYELRWRHGFEGAAELPAGFATLGARSRANVQATNFYLSKWPAAA